MPRQQKSYITDPFRRKLLPLYLFSVLLLVGLVYSNTLNSPPVLDDRATFINNPSIYIENLSFDSLKKVHSGRFGRNRFIPMLTFAIDQMLGQGNIAQFHLTNIAIHLLATIAVFLLVLGLTNSGIGRRSLILMDPALFSLFVAAFWALHPIQTNAVTYLVQRMASSAALFYYTSLAGYIWARIGSTRLSKKSGWLFFVLGMGGAFFSKENSATLPLAVLLVETFFISPNLVGKVVRRVRRHHRLFIILLVLLFLPYAATKIVYFANDYAEHGRHFTMLERLLTEFRVVVFYISLLALPIPGRLNLDHDFPVSLSLFAPLSTCLSLLILAFLTVLIFRKRKSHPFISFGIFFFFLNLIIESSIIPLELVFEHRLYLPSLGFFLISMSAVDHGSKLIPSKDGNELKTVVVLGLVIVCCISAISTSLRNHTWRSRLSLHKDIAAKSPFKPRAHTNLGKELMLLGQYEDALLTLNKAISLGKGQSEEYIKAANNIVSVFVSQERYEKAIEWGTRLLKNRPEERLNFDGFPVLMTNIAFSYWKLGDFNRSLEAFREGLKIRHPRHTPLLLEGMETMLLDASNSLDGRAQLGLARGKQSVYSRIAAILLINKDYTNAGIFLTKALTIDPGNETTGSIKKIFDKETTLNQQALSSIIELNKKESSNFFLNLKLGMVEFIQENYILLKPAVGPLLKSAFKHAPSSPKAAYKLSKWYLRNGETSKALDLATKALDKMPKNPELIELKAQCYFIKGDNKKSADLLYKLLETYPGHPDRERYYRYIQTYY